MMEFAQMMARLIVALLLGGVMGLEREHAGKEAGIRTSMLVAGGAAIFALIALNAPYLVGPGSSDAALTIIANIVVGIGFLGAGIIIQTKERVHGLTTAAAIWTTAAVGTLAGIGFTKFAVVSAVLVSGLLFLLRVLGISERLNPPTH